MADDRKTPLQPTRNFRSLLQSEYLRRTRTNPRYSLRAFAAFLKLNHGALSRILAGSRALTPKMIEKIGTRLGLSPQEIREFTGSKSLRQSTPLTSEMLREMDRWFYPVIFELATVRGFKPQPKWIAARLSISEGEAQEAFDRLVRFGLLQQDSKGNWIQAEPYVQGSQERLPKLATEQFEKALTAAKKMPFSEKAENSMIVAMDSGQLPHAARAIDEFTQDFARKMQKRRKRDRVYQLAISFIPVDSGN